MTTIDSRMNPNQIQKSLVPCCASGRKVSAGQYCSQPLSPFSSRCCVMAAQTYTDVPIVSSPANAYRTYAGRNQKSLILFPDHLRPSAQSAAKLACSTPSSQGKQDFG